MHVVGIDIGTTTIGYAVMDCTGDASNAGRTGDAGRAVVASGSYSHHAALPDDPTCQNVRTLYRAARDTIAQLRERHGQPAAIGVSGQMHGILYLDGNGEACSPLYTWLYGGAEPYLAEISERSGYSLSVGYGLATHYANQRQGRVPSSATALCTIMDYIVMRLGGLARPVSDPTCMASLGLYQVERQQFDRAALATLGIDDIRLPAIVPTTTRVGTTSDGSAIIAAIGDNQAGYIGACGLDDERAALFINIGTSAQIAFSATSYTPHSPTRAIEWRPLTAGRYLVVGSALCGGKALELLARLSADAYRLYSGGKPPSDIYAGIARFQREWLAGRGRATDRKRAKTMSDHQRAEPPLRIDTRFTGSRDDPARRGSIANIGMTNLNMGDLIYGFMEGIIDELYALWERATTPTASSAPPPQVLVGSGSALRKNPLLQHLAAERWGQKIHLPPYCEEAAVGAARIAC